MLGPIRPLTNLILLRSFSGAVPRVMSTIVAVAMSLENPQRALRSWGCGHVVDMRSNQTRSQILSEPSQSGGGRRIFSRNSGESRPRENFVRTRVITVTLEGT
ncbi:hypothetical protein L226DRAFT_49932 [Lentinus tigrinus ALCF2SS1-7]|uniref:uncharacterized protein n=1 Tax=Lentinus tigrinus ALCF2SS1-7 TaxID=1328758 RepID=UPI001166003F|nr:hypothetical protein L226DRAFT_49932 [Lentinus tigrinus ALCF2SS1-7]